MRFIHPKCAKCKKTVPAKNAIRLTWKHKGIDVDFCPNCFQEVYIKGLKDISINKKIIAQSGVDKGAKEIDIKRYLERWAKKTKQIKE